jgi:hypothetical protein
MITKDQIRKSSEQLSKLEALSNVPEILIEANREERIYIRELSEGLMLNDVKKFQDFLDRYEGIIRSYYKKIGGKK